MVYGIICAMPEEFGALEKEIQGSTTVEVFGRRFISGSINGNAVVAVISRIGKVAAAVTTALLIEKFKVDSIIFCGIAGSLNKNVKIGDIVIATDCVQHDFYLSDSDIFRIPLLNISSIPCDRALSEKCKKAAESFKEKAYLDEEILEFYKSVNIKEPNVFMGTIASGDQFISDNSKKEWIAERIKTALAVEMEGAAVAQAAYEAQIPCAVIRVISDGADENADINFEKFVNASSLFSRGIFKEFFA